MNILACDPGASGGFCYRPSDSTMGSLTTLPMPETRQEAVRAVRGAFRQGCDTLVIEKVGGYVGGQGQPGARMFVFGFWTGVVIGSAEALGMKVIEVAPRAWQSFYQLDSSLLTKSQWKGKLRDEAKKLYPKLKPTLKTADAILIHHAFVNSLYLKHQTLESKNGKHNSSP